MGCPATGQQDAAALRERWVFTYRVEGDVRFISHRDTVRLFQRALARACLPVRYTEGFNPHMRLSIPLPRPVGVASAAEALVVEFSCPVDGEEVVRRLGRQLPGGVTIHGARRLVGRERLEPTAVRYRVEPGTPLCAGLAARARALMEARSVRVQRWDRKKQRFRGFDARPLILDIQVGENMVEFTLRVTDGGTVKPAEIAGLLGFDGVPINHRIRRMNVEWKRGAPQT